MTDIANANAGSQSLKIASAFLDALRNGFNFGTAQGDVFSDLLKQTTASLSRTADTDAGASGDTARTTTATDTTQAFPTSVTTKEDRAAVRALLQRIREESQDLYHSRQRIKHVSSSKQKDDTTATDDTHAPSDDVDETVSAAADDDTAPVAEADSSTDDAAADSATTGEETGAAATDTTKGDETALLLAAAAAGTEETSTDDPSSAAADETADGSAADDVPEANVDKSFLQAEQAAFFLLNRLFHSRFSSPQKTEDESKTQTVAATTDDGTNAGGKIAEVGMAYADALFSRFSAGAKGKTPESLTPGEETGSDVGTPGTDPVVQTGSSATAAKALPDTDAAVPVDTGNKHRGHVDFLNLFQNMADTAPAATGNTVAMATPETALTQGTSASGVTGVSEAAGSAVSVQAGNGTGNTLVPGLARHTGSADFATHMAATRGSNGATASTTTPVEQVVLQLHKQIKDGVQEMTLQLRPEELGRIDIKLSFTDDNKVKGIVVADNPATLDLLLKDVGSLQRALQDAGLRADSGSLQFSLRGDGQSNMFNANTNGQSNGNGSSGGSGSSNPLFADDEDAGVMADAGIETWYLTPGRINLQV